MNIRKGLFWTLDILRGSKLRRDSNDIKKSLSGKGIGSQNRALADLLEYVKKDVPFYKQYASANSLSQFPVVDKSTIKSDWDSFVSSSADKKELSIVTTSGSTGTPFQIYIDRRKKRRNYADTLHFSSLSGYSLGTPLLYMKIWVKVKMAAPLKYKASNIVPIDVINFSDREAKYVIEQIQKSKCGILAYASVLDIITQYIRKNNLCIPSPKISSVIAMSESLSQQTKKHLSEVLKVGVVSRYSNLECGIMAQQLTDGADRYLINRASYVVEILKMDSNEAAEVGESGRIVVTDLYNYAQPMIRYDTGDVGAFEDSEKLFLGKVEGRRLDLLYSTSGNLVSSYIVYKNMWQYPEIDQYQLIQQTEKQYEINIVSQNFTRETQLIAEFREFLGANATITIHYLNEIPLLASGKRKKVVNNYRH